MRPLSLRKKMEEQEKKAVTRLLQLKN